MRIGWIGLGAMGGPMASWLGRDGFDVYAYDVDEARAREVSGAGVRAVSSMREVARSSGVVVLMVATPEQAEQVLFGDAGIAGVMRPGAVVLLMATVGPEPVRRWATLLGEESIDIVDAPVSGGVSRAAMGDLLIMVGGHADAVEKIRPVLASLAREAPVVGDKPGDGQRLKLVNQLLCGVHIAVAAEALAFAEALQLDPRACWEVLRHGAAASFMLDDRGERLLAGNHEDVRSAVGIFVKDMGLVVDAARESGFEPPLAGIARELYQEGSRMGLGRLDDSAVIEVLRAKRADGRATS